MPHKTSPKKSGNAEAGRDAITGDLSRVEALLAEVVALLRQPQSTVTVERNTGVIIVGSGNEVRNISRIEADKIGALQRGPDPRRREEAYLIARFIIGDLYARWNQEYVALAGHLLDAPLRLTDRGDQGISGAGLQLGDIREALQAYQKTRLVILGEPGAGKTTTLERLAFDLARERLRDPANGKLPVRIDLFEFTGDPDPDQFLAAAWQTLGVPLSYGEAINGGQVCFLLDGVNQMPIADRTKRINRWSHWANVKLPPGNWAVFTCRTADYVPNLLLPEVQVLSLDAGRMRRYIQLRAGPKADDLWKTFEGRLRSGADRFERLAQNPFMLSRLVDRALKGKALTDSRAVLLGDLATDLLDRELQGDRQPETLTADPVGTLTAARAALGRLAFAMQAQGEGTGLTRALAGSVKLAEDGQAALTLDELLKLVKDATVLVAAEGQGDETVYAFYHHLLQEYFAARELLRLFKANQNLSQHWRVDWELEKLGDADLSEGRQLPPPPVTGWEETVIMAAGLADKDAPRFITAVHKDNLPLAGRCLVEAGLGRDDLKPLVEHTQSDLLARQRSSAAHLRARIDAGLALGELGHPDLKPQEFEFEGKMVRAIVPKLEDVPAGEFIRGSDPADKRAFPNEYTTERKVNTPAFSIGRYPVTNAEYKFFVEAEGYKDDRWWSEEGAKWKQGGPEAHAESIEDWLRYRKIVKDFGVEEAARQLNWRPQDTQFWKEVTQLSEDEARERARKQFDRPFDRPAFWDDRVLGSPGRPVVGVNWREAEAYCNWLSAVTGRAFRLPSGMEWEKAARGVDGREYPWGEKFDSQLCNTVESHIYLTTPVGLYPDGVSPYGLFDAGGNVWEWTVDWYQMYPGGQPSDDFGDAKRFKDLRGGSWGNVHRFARCAYRNRLAPVNFIVLIGFRLFSPAL